MQYKCVNLDNMDLYFVKTNKFKSIDIKIFFSSEVKKDDITWRNCLVDILAYANKKYPTKKELSIKLEELYSPYLITSNMRFGNYLVSKIGVSLLNPQYTEDGMLEESLNLLHNVLYEPLVEDNHFKKEYLDFIKKEHKADTETIKEDPKVYSNIQLLKNMDKDMPYTYTGYSDLSVLDKINEYNLYEYYQKFIKNNKVFVIIVGDVCEQQIIDYFSQNFKFVNNDIDKNLVISHKKIRKRAKIVVEEADYQQSKLAMAFKIKDLTDFEYRYVLNIYNAILGGSADNKLMRMIRENNSLAYYVRSSISKADNLMFVNSGFDSKNYKRVMKLIKEALNDISNGDITEEEIKKGKMEYVTSFDEALETSSGHIDVLLGQVLFDAKSVEKRKEEIMNVTKEDVINLAKKVHVDTVFLLKGAQNGREQI